MLGHGLLWYSNAIGQTLHFYLGTPLWCEQNGAQI